MDRLRNVEQRQRNRPLAYDLLAPMIYGRF
jgi:hypothetical protein